MRILLAFVLLLGCSGCALIEDTVDLNYISVVPQGPVLGASSVRVGVTVADARTGRPDQISVKKNGYGMEMARILSAKPVPDLLKAAIIDELTKKGFQLGAGNLVVSIELNKFNNDFKTGFFSGNAVAEVTFSTQVVAPDGRILFAKNVTGDNDLSGIQLMEGRNAKASLEPALSAAVAKLVSDPAFTRALLQGGNPRPGS